MHPESAATGTADLRADAEDKVSWPLWGIIAVSLSASIAAGLTGALQAGSRQDFIMVGFAVAVLAAGTAYYGRVRGDRRLARLFRAAAEFLLLALSIGSLSYVAAALNRPLWDDVFAAWDSSLGFHWPDWLRLVNEHPRVHVVLAAAYHSMAPQFAIVLVALLAVRNYRATDVYLIAFALSAWICVSVSALMPGLSPLVHFGITPAEYPNISLAVPLEFATHVQALRSGTLQITDLGGAQGLVTFPSFHTSSAVILMLAFWQVPYVRWLGVLVNGTMLLAIPVEGSHYIVDVIAGIAVGLGAWKAAMVLRPLRTAPADPRPIAAAAVPAE